MRCLSFESSDKCISCTIFQPITEIIWTWQPDWARHLHLGKLHLSAQPNFQVTFMMPTTNHRVAMSTSDSVNRHIREQTSQNVIDHASAGPDAINERLRELDQEWDVERAIEANASTLALAGLLLGVTVNRKWLLLPGVITVFLFQHAIQGWCPPVPILRRLGVRTSAEINEERYALKALRGDFNAASSEPILGRRIQESLAASVQ